MNVTVLGATGGIGRAIVDTLVHRGHEVTAVSRTITADDVPAGVRVVAADLLGDPTAATAACTGSDVVVMAASLPYPDWRDRLLPMVDAALAAAIAVDARLVMVDNLYAYGAPATDITDASPQDGPSRKAALRREVGDRLLAAHRRGDVRVTVGRFSDYYGPYGANSLIGMLMIDRVLAGKAPQAFIDADQPHTFAYLPDAARGFVTLVERPEADGRGWILPAAEPVTQRELARLVCAAAGASQRLGRITPAMLWLAGLTNANLREAREQVPQFDRPYVALADEFTATFGPHELTPHDVAITATVTARQRAPVPA